MRRRGKPVRVYGAANGDTGGWHRHSPVQSKNTDTNSADHTRFTHMSPARTDVHWLVCCALIYPLDQYRHGQMRRHWVPGLEVAIIVWGSGTRGWAALRHARPRDLNLAVPRNIYLYLGTTASFQELNNPYRHLVQLHTLGHPYR